MASIAGTAGTVAAFPGNGCAACQIGITGCAGAGMGWDGIPITVDWYLVSIGSATATFGMLTEPTPAVAKLRASEMRIDLLNMVVN